MVIRVHFPLSEGKKPQLGLAAALHVGGFTKGSVEVGPEYSKLDRLNEEAPNAFEAVDLDQADVVVYPYCAESGPAVDAVAEAARMRNIGCVFFSWGDADKPVKVPYGTVYRHSLFADRRLDCERAMACEVSDPRMEIGLPIWPREKRPTPRVGFCGAVSNPLMRTVYRMMRRQRKAEGLAMRARALRALKRTKGLETNFISRQSYWAGSRGRFHRNVDGEFRPRAAFWNNVLNSDYTLCMRGAGNFSYRFYEVLAAGRIPLLLDTRCVLPFDDEIEWRQHCVWVEEDQHESAGEILKEFHSGVSPDQFRTLQMANRRLWETKLSPLGFLKRALAKEVSRTARAPGWNGEFGSAVV